MTNTSNTPALDARLKSDTQDGVRCLTIDDPATRNALAPEISLALTAQIQAAADEGVGALVLTGAGGHFCSGGDVRGLSAQQALPPAAQVRRIGVLNELVRTIRQSPVPVVAAVEGAAAGAGFSLMLACDLAVAAEDARFVMAYVKLGLTPDGGGSFHLARALPAPQAFAAIALGDPIDAATLHRAGLVHAVVPPGQALADALALARRLADGPREAIGDAKRLVQAVSMQGLDAQLEQERHSFVRHLHGTHARQAVQAFLNRPSRKKLK